MLRTLSVHRFRNLPDLVWEVDPGAHLVIAGNGAGKTSLLEAVYLAATARSFRTSQLEDCARHTPEPTEATAAAGGEPEPAAVGFAVRAVTAGPPIAELAVAWSDRGLARTLDGKAVPLATYLGALPVVVWSAREDQILAGVPERRRRMIDAGLVAERADRVALLARYRRVLAHKRELLRRRQGGLEAWNGLLAEAGASLARLRADWVERLAARLEVEIAVSGRPFPRVTLRYEPSPPAALAGTAALSEALAAAAADEMRLGRPCIGQHLDRLSILWGGLDVSRVASAGERKALGLLLVAAQAALATSEGRAPLILADDVDAELDPEALAMVWRVLSPGRQVLATSSRPEISGLLEGFSEWSIVGGRPAPK